MQSAAYIRLKIKAEGNKLIHVATACLNSLSERILCIERFSVECRKPK